MQFRQKPFVYIEQCIYWIISIYSPRGYVNLRDDLKALVVLLCVFVYQIKSQLSMVVFFANIVYSFVTSKVTPYPILRIAATHS